MIPQEEQRLKARFFGMYIGCKAVGNLQRGVATGLVSGASILDEKLTVFVSSHMGEFELIDEQKLILRQLSSITDEEAVEVFTKATGMYIVEIKRDSEKIVGVGMGRNAGHTIGGGGNVAMWLKTSPLPIGRFLETWNSYQGGENPEYMDFIAVDYLRSLGFCLPFMGLDPVQKGWAILEETANQPQG